MAEKKRKKRYEEEDYRYEENAEVDESSLGSTIKGMIAVMITLLVVVIIIMVFAKSLFIPSGTTSVKTGIVTSTEYIAPITTTTEEVTQAVTTTTAATTEDPYTTEDEEDEETAVDIQCISAVYLHPQPTSSSETLLTIPKGATCKYYRNESGWYYVEYNGTKGYAWKTFFETPQTDE